jgi:hypothetical protein
VSRRSAPKSKGHAKAQVAAEVSRQSVDGGCRAKVRVKPHAASLGIDRSTNRKNRVLRARATMPSCDLTPLSTPAFVTDKAVLVGANCVKAAGRPHPIKLGDMPAVLHSSVS